VLIARRRSHGLILCPIKFGTLLIDPHSHRASTPENELPRIVPCPTGFWRLSLDPGSHRTLIAHC